MEQLKHILAKHVRRIGLDEQVRASSVTQRARDWLRERLPALRDALEVRTFDGEQLIIACSHPLAAQELQDCAHELVAFLRLQGAGALSSLRIIRETGLAKAPNAP
jgi:hypothetical protein